MTNPEPRPSLMTGRPGPLVPLPWEDLAGRTWRLNEAFTGEIYARDGLELRQLGLFVDLEGWQFHFFQVTCGVCRPVFGLDFPSYHY